MKKGLIVPDFERKDFKAVGDIGIDNAMLTLIYNNLSLPCFIFIEGVSDLL